MALESTALDRQELAPAEFDGHRLTTVRTTQEEPLPAMSHTSQL